MRFWQAWSELIEMHHQVPNLNPNANPGRCLVISSNPPQVVTMLAPCIYPIIFYDLQLVPRAVNIPSPLP